MTSSTGRFIIVFNGEIYNHSALRKELDEGGDGVTWHGHSDTETLLRGFEVWGLKETLTRAVGMFALALYDKESRRLILARDRMGEKPLYYAWNNGLLLFGSELKGLRAHPDCPTAIDPVALSHFFRRAYVPAPLTIQAGVRKLPPAHVMTAGFDPLLDEGRAYAERLAKEGTPVAYREYGDMVHGFITMGRILDTANAALADCAAALPPARPRA